MELNAEINRVVGEELSKLIVKKIEDDELEQMAQKAYKSVTEHDYDGWSYNRMSQLDKAVENMFLTKLQEEAEKIINSDVGQEEIQQRTAELIQRITDRTMEKIVESVSSRIATMSVSYNGMNFGMLVCDEVRDQFRPRRGD